VRRAAASASLGLGALVLILAGAAPPAEAQRLGRLFTSVDERAHLDELRYQAQFATPQPAPEPAAAATSAPEQAAPDVSSLTVNGIVRGSSGRGTVWVNGNQIERGGTTREGIQVNTAGAGGRSVRARLPSGVDTIEIKPGQKIDVIHGVVLEPYERGEHTPAGPSAFELDAGEAGATPGTGSAAPAALPATGAAPAAGATGAQRDAEVDEVLRRAMDAMPAPETLTPEGRAQAEDVRRQLERAAAGNAPAKR
jgi:hypothetical protein